MIIGPPPKFHEIQDILGHNAGPDSEDAAGRAPAVPPQPSSQQPVATLKFRMLESNTSR
jgi:hypothetical protein